MRSERRYTWSGHARGEGGPILVADLEDYLFWSGSDRRWEEDSVYVVHYYGPLVRRLPARFHPQDPEEWHQTARVSTMTAARGYVQDLSAAVLAHEPSALQREQLPMNREELNAKLEAASGTGGDSYRAALDSWRSAWRDHVEQGIDFTVSDERILHVDVKPDTDYARGCDAMTDDAARIEFGPGRQGVLWELEGSGTADIATTEDRSEFLLLRTWITDETDEQEARGHVLGAPTGEQMAEVSLRGGTVVVVWSPIRPSDLAPNEDAGNWLRAAAQREPSVQLEALDARNVGTLLQVQPGDYRVACGFHKTEHWSCRWARFSRVEK